MVLKQTRKRLFLFFFSILLNNSKNKVCVKLIFFGSPEFLPCTFFWGDAILVIKAGDLTDEACHPW